MSDAFLLTGKRGNGKSLSALAMMRNYLSEGRPIATNLDIRPENLAHASIKTCCYRVPDWPTASDLSSLPLGNPGLRWVDGQPERQPDFQEDKNGLLVLDEVVTFLSARQWQGSGRQDLINWFAQSRKYGWDLCLICQHPRMLDSAIRDSLIDLHGVTKRLDKIMIPVLGPLVKFFTGKPLRFPKIHVTTFFYGFGQSAPKSDVWKFFGKDLYDAYNSFQIIDGNLGQTGAYTYLSPYLVRGRYMSVFEMYKRVIIMAMVIGLFFGGVGGFFAGKYTGASSSQSASSAVAQVKEEIKEGVSVVGTIDENGLTRVILSDGLIKMSSASKADKDGIRYLVDGGWYRVAK